jgi:hypothetical protein
MSAELRYLLFGMCDSREFRGTGID